MAPPPFYITDDEPREGAEELDAEAAIAAATAKGAPAHRAFAEAVAEQAKISAKETGSAVPMEHRSYGVTTCSAKACEAAIFFTKAAPKALI